MDLGDLYLRTPKEYRNIYLVKQTEKNSIDKRILQISNKINEHRKELLIIKNAREFFEVILLELQDNIKIQIESLATLAVQDVFGDEYKYSLQFEVKRNNVEATPLIIENGVSNEMWEIGGSVRHVLGLGMRLSFYFMQKNIIPPILLLDEPGKDCGELIHEFGVMLRDASALLGVQVIFVTHDPELTEFADKKFYVTKKDGVSIVTELKNETSN